MSRKKTLVILGMLAMVTCGVGQGKTDEPGRENGGTELASVRAGLEMTDLADYWTAAQGTVPCGVPGAIASLAPNGRQFVVVLRRGDIQHNWNHYTMLLWKTRALGTEKPRTLIEMDSSSARPAIDPESISWGRDGWTLMFLGEVPGGRHEVYEVDLQTGKLSALTDAPLNVTNYSRAVSRNRMAYEGALPPKSLWSANTARQGLAVTSQSIVDVLEGEGNAAPFGGSKLLIKDWSGIKDVEPMPGNVFLTSLQGQDAQNISMSPNGRYVVALEAMSAEYVLPEWRRYNDWLTQFVFFELPHLQRNDSGAVFPGFTHYVLIDLKTGKSRILLQSPVLSALATHVVWAHDSHGVVLSGVLLPIGMKGAEKGGRTTVEIDVKTGNITKIGHDCAFPLSWTDKELICSGTADWREMTNHRANQSQSSLNAFQMQHGKTCPAPQRRRFAKVGGKWDAVGLSEPFPVNISVEEGMNSPPKLYYQTRGQRSKLLLDLNPELRHVRLSNERMVTWEWSKGHSITGGLYFPIDYQPGRRYPLVIQTHGFKPTTFNFFGPFPTAFAAQPLAARNMFVLQIGAEFRDLTFSPDEREQAEKGRDLKMIKRAVEIYKSAIVYLAHEGYIDPKRVGIIGFSLSSICVHWALAHDPRLFAAASVNEGDDGSDLEYMLNLNTDVTASGGIYSGPPFGADLKSWAALSPIFNINRVETPLLIGVLHHEYALYEWEWLDGLRALKKPVYMVVLDGRTHDLHMLQEPWDRLIVSGDNVDWFDFWLNGHEDSDATKRIQYDSWEKMRALHEREQREGPVLSN